MKDVSRAKELFLYFAGSHFQMEREKMLDEYCAFGIPQDTEKIWARECAHSLLLHFRQIGVADGATLHLSQVIFGYGLYDLLLELFSAIEEKANSMDTFTMILLCEEISTAISSLEKKKDKDERILRRACNLVSGLSQVAQKSPITVAEYYQARFKSSGVLEPQILRLRIEKLVKEVESGEIRRRDMGK